MSDLIKMADVFELPVTGDSLSFIKVSIATPEYRDGVTPHDMAAEAINNHDRLIAENEALREEVERLRKDISDKKFAFKQRGKTLEAVRQERDQLNRRWTRFNEVMGQIHQECDGGDEFDDDPIPAVLWELWRSPETSLASHDAEVIERACAHVDDITYGHKVTQWFRGYANQLRQQAKEVQS